MTNKVKTPPEDRIYDDDDGFFLRAASVCVRDQNESEVLLVSSHSKPGRWIIPGGKIQANEDPGTSAAREAMEEAGAQGRLGRTLGTFADPDRKHRTTVFVLHVDTENGGLVDDFEEKDHRLRRWFPIDEAKYILAKPLHAKYLNALEESSSSIIYIPDNNVSQTQSDSFPDTTPTNSNSRLHHHNGALEASSLTCCSLRSYDKINTISCADENFDHTPAFCGIQAAPNLENSNATNRKSHLSATVELVNAVNLRVTNGMKPSNRV